MLQKQCGRFGWIELQNVMVHEIEIGPSQLRHDRGRQDRDTGMIVESCVSLARVAVGGFANSKRVLHRIGIGAVHRGRLRGHHERQGGLVEAEFRQVRFGPIGSELLGVEPCPNSGRDVGRRRVRLKGSGRRFGDPPRTILLLQLQCRLAAFALHGEKCRGADRNEVAVDQFEGGMICRCDKRLADNENGFLLFIAKLGEAITLIVRLTDEQRALFRWVLRVRLGGGDQGQPQVGLVEAVSL